MLRNISDFFRSRHSSFFAWFGEISLELFVGQSHIWLAGDTHGKDRKRWIWKCISVYKKRILLSYIILFLISGVLVLIPNYPVVNILLTSFIFACAAHEIHLITTILVKILVPDNKFKVVLRNTLLFIAILIPIGIQDGMFWKEVWNDFLHLLKVQCHYQGVLSRRKSRPAWKSFFYVTKKLLIFYKIVIIEIQPKKN